MERHPGDAFGDEMDAYPVFCLADPAAPLLAATFNPPALGSTSSRRSALSSVLRTEFSPGSRLTRLWVVVIRIQSDSAPPLFRFIPLSELAVFESQAPKFAPTSRTRATVLLASFERYFSFQAEFSHRAHY